MSVIWYKGFTNCIWASDKSLQDFQCNSYNFWISSVQSSFDWDNKLWNNWKYFSTTFFEHIKNTLDCKESIWINLFPYSFEENWEIMMVIKLLNIDFPINFVLWAVFDSDWKISSIVEKSKFTDWNLSTVDSSSSWLNWYWFWFCLIQTEALSTVTVSLFQKSCSMSSNRYLLLVDWSNVGNSSSFFIDVFLWKITEGRMLSSW